MTEEIEAAVNPDEPQAQPTGDSPAPAPKAEPEVTPTPDADPAPAPDDKSKGDPAPAADEDWRVKLAGGDEKELKRLGRFSSPTDIYKAYRELEKKKSDGTLKNGLPENPTPEELTQWRKENNIPESSDKYDLTFDDGLVIGAEDKPIIDEFASAMHDKNATNDQVKTAVSTYYGMLAAQQAAQDEGDVTAKDESLEILREEWGADRKKNEAAVRNLMDSMPDDVRPAFESARMPDGTVAGSNAALIQWLAQTAYELNPAAALMPANSSNPSAGLKAEIAELEAKVGDAESDYWTGPNAEKMQRRYSELLSADAKSTAKG